MFRALWIAQFASNVGTWMQTVGAQWLLIDRSPLLVSLVQTASSLPIVLLALPAGALGRRRRPAAAAAGRAGGDVRRRGGPGRGHLPRRDVPGADPAA